MGAFLAATAVAGLHGLLAAFIILGAPLAARRPRLMPWYLAALAPTALVNLFRWPCPLTVWEKGLWTHAGRVPYRGGYISHYFVEPIYPAGLGPRGEVAIIVCVTIWCTTWLGYAALARLNRARAARAAATHVCD